MNIEELKRLAEAATPGPWVSHPKGYYGAVCRADDQYDLVAVTHGQRRNNVLANEAFIAAANPAAILELIQQRDELLAALEQERKRLDWAMKKQAYYGRSPDRLWVDVGTGNHKWFAVYDDNPRATIDELMVK